MESSQVNAPVKSQDSESSFGNHPMQESSFSGAGASLPPPPFQLKSTAEPIQRVGGDKEDTKTPYQPKDGDKVSKSVGMGGKNENKDVRIVQYHLIKKGYLPATDKDGNSTITGVCDDETLFAIRQIQTQVVEAKDLDARVDPNGSIEKALLGTKSKSRVDLKADKGFIGKIQKSFPNGINVALWANYTDQSNNNKEFKRAADKYSSAYNSVGFDTSGNLKIGMANPITSEADVINAINDIHNLLVAEYNKSTEKPAAEPPAFTKIKTLALFAHGLPYGMSMGASKAYNLKINTKEDEKEFEMFVRAIKGPLKNDVDVNLMACNAGRETDITENRKSKYGKEGVWYISDADKQDGDTSFAGKFAEELGKDASVYAHLTRGHTVNNYAARVFGADAGKDPTKDKGGIHIFHLLYPDTFITSEATRLKKEEKKVKKQMEKHYKKRMQQSLDGGFKIKEGEKERNVNQLGAEMFTDLEGTKTMLQTDWKTWVKSNPVP